MELFNKKMGSGSGLGNEVIPPKDSCLHGLGWGSGERPLEMGGLIFHSSTVCQKLLVLKERQKTVSSGFCYADTPLWLPGPLTSTRALLQKGELFSRICVKGHF